MKRILTTWVVYMGLASFTMAQTPVKLTFEEALKIALKNNVLLNQQKNNLELSQMQKLAAFANAGPSVTLNGTAQRFNGNSFNQQEARVVNGVRDQVSGSANANITLFNGFSTLNSIRQSNSALEAQSYFVNRTTQDVINTVSNQYLQVLLDIELVRIAKENHAAQNKLLQQVKEQVALGSRSPVEEHNQNALTKAAELRMVQAEITLDNDRAQLAQTLLIDPLEVFEVVKPEWDPNLIGTEQLSINNLVETAKTSRSDYLRAEKNEMAARYGLAAQRGQLAPNLSAFVSVGSSYNFQHDVPDSVRDDSGSLVLNPFKPRPFAEQFRTNNVYKAYGLQLTIPIVTGFRTRTSVTQQRVQYRNNQLVRRNLEYQIRSDVFRAVKTFEGTKKAYAVTVAQLEAANTAFLLESERYNLGVTNFVDYTNANRALVQAQTDKAQAEYRLVFQKILVDYAVGTLKPEDIIQE